MKTIIVLAIGAALGIFGMKYHEDAKFAKETNTHLGTAVTAASGAVQGAWQSANK